MVTEVVHHKDREYALRLLSLFVVAFLIPISGYAQEAQPIDEVLVAITALNVDIDEFDRQATASDIESEKEELVQRARELRNERRLEFAVLAEKRFENLSASQKAVVTGFIRSDLQYVISRFDTVERRLTKSRKALGKSDEEKIEDVEDDIDAARGDLIRVADIEGVVDKMTLVSTEVLTLDNQRFIVPNNKVSQNVIQNVTAEPTRRVDLLFGVGYDDNLEQVETVLREIVESEEHVLNEPQPIIKLHELGDSSVNFVVRLWVQTDVYWDAYWNVTRRVKDRFDAENISIPYPQRDIHVHNPE